jgi:hypothetical protein
MNLHSDLELMIVHDMWINGFDPTIPADVQEYWEQRLS